jgi:hypothetical protein
MRDECCMRAQISPPSSMTSLITRIVFSQCMEKNVSTFAILRLYLLFDLSLLLVLYLPPMALLHAMATREGHVFFIATAAN